MVLPLSRVSAVKPFPDTLTAGVRTVLRREPDGTITIVSLATSWRAAATREADGTITLAKA